MILSEHLNSGVYYVNASVCDIGVPWVTGEDRVGVNGHFSLLLTHVREHSPKLGNVGYSPFCTAGYKVMWGWTLLLQLRCQPEEKRRR